MRRRSETAARIAAIVAAVVIVYGPTLAFELTHFDDDRLVLYDHEFLRQPGNVARAFQRDAFGKATPAYRPGLTLTLMLDAWIGGTKPLGYHASNVAIHALASVGLFFALASLGYPRGPSGAAAIVVAVHPLLASAVAWIPGRNDSLLALFALLSWIAFVRGLSPGSAAACAVSLGAFAAALFTKETAIVLPGLAALYGVLFARERLRSRPAAWLAGGSLGVIVVWWLLRAAALAGSKPLGVSGETVLRNLRTIPEMLAGVVLPFPRALLPTFDARSLVAGAVVAAVVATAMVLVERERRRFVVFGVAWFVGFLAPTLVWREPYAAFDYLDHRAWLPLVGMAIVGLEIARRAPARIVRWGTVTIVVVLAGLAGWQSRHFRDGVTFWTAAVSQTPQSAEAHHMLGVVRHMRGDLEGARAAYRRAIEIQPSHAEITPRFHVNLGRLYDAKGQREQAAREYERAIQLAPRFGAAHLNLGTIRFQEGRIVDAEAHFLQAVALDPDLALAHSHLCGVRLLQRRFDVAERFCKRALELQPDLVRLRIVLALAYHGQNRWEEAGALVDDLRARGVAVERELPDVVAALRARRR